MFQFLRYCSYNLKLCLFRVKSFLCSNADPATGGAVAGAVAAASDVTTAKSVAQMEAAAEVPVSQ